MTYAVDGLQANESGLSVWCLVSVCSDGGAGVDGAIPQLDDQHL